MSELSEPTVQALDPERLAQLRRRASSRLTGTAATKGASARAADALTVLHALASCPDTAPDALTLLHELQVHQVELDLQAQELQDSRAELEAALRRQLELYDFQPVGCFTVDARRVLLELNRTGAEMLGIGRDDALGLPLEAFFGADSERRLTSAIASVDAGRERPSCILQLCPKGGSQRPVLASFGKDVTANRYLVSLALLGDDPSLRSEAP
jgi:PAS domain-containing protein